MQGTEDVCVSYSRGGWEVERKQRKLQGRWQPRCRCPDGAAGRSPPHRRPPPRQAALQDGTRKPWRRRAHPAHRAHARCPQRARAPHTPRASALEDWSLRGALLLRRWCCCCRRRLRRCRYCCSGGAAPRLRRSIYPSVILPSVVTLMAVPTLPHILAPFPVRRFPLLLCAALSPHPLAPRSLRGTQPCLTSRMLPRVLTRLSLGDVPVRLCRPSRCNSTAAWISKVRCFSYPS